jgi:hypothetical protein
MVISAASDWVELAGGTVLVTRSFCSGDEVSVVRVTLSKPASLSMRSASSGLKFDTSGMLRSSAPADTLTVMSAPALTEELADGSVPITCLASTVESGLDSRCGLNPALCSAAIASSCGFPLTSGTCSRPARLVMAMVATIASTASTAPTASQRRTGRRVDPSSAGTTGKGCVRWLLRDGGADGSVVSASMGAAGAAGAWPLWTRTRSVRMSAAVW